MNNTTTPPEMHMGIRAIDENGEHICDDQGDGFCWVCGAWMTPEAVAGGLREMAEWSDHPDNARVVVQPSPVHPHLRYTAGYLLRLIATALVTPTDSPTNPPPTGETE